MRSVRQIFSIVISSLYNLVFSKKFVIFLAIVFVFCSYTFAGLNDIASFYEMKVSAYVFPFYLSNPSMMLIFGALVIYIFSDVPFTEQNTYFMLARTNRKIYYIAKILYIFITAVIVTATFVLFSIILIFPNADFTNQWGKIIYTLISNPQTILEQTNATIGFGINSLVVNEFMPLTAMAYSITLMVMVVFFMGIIIMFVSLMVSRSASFVVSGFFVSLSYFAVFLGAFTFQGFLYFVSPFSWCSLNWLDIYDSGLAPSPPGAMLAILCITAVLGIIAFFKFNYSDLKIQ